MDESEEKQGQDSRKAGSRCDSKQLALLRKCSEKNNMTEWNKWRDENPDEIILLQGAHLEKTYLRGANLKNACLNYANLSESDLTLVKLEGAELFNTNLKGAHLVYSDFKGARLWRTNLKKAIIGYGHFEGATLTYAHLEGAKLGWSYLEGAIFTGTHLDGVDLRASIVNGSTLFWKCSVDRHTDFRGVGLHSYRIDERTRYLLEYNKRRLNWEDWYEGTSEKKWVRKMRQVLICPVRLFWCLSDYGRSTIRILAVFLALAVVFAVAYWAKPDCVIVNGQVGGLVDFLHALYFSVVTMTTLGFGDIAANPQSSCGQVLLMLQVFCGYFLLGAIVTRLSILFTTGGPTGRFSKKEK